tara:strand:+ start:2442 stop:3734 length:1293 start_codon:yes stop_codon:yes gene_type:complete
MANESKKLSALTAMGAIADTDEVYVNDAGVSASSTFLNLMNSFRDANGSLSGLMSVAQNDKLAGIETLADVTDATNVAAATAVMDADFSAADGTMIKTGAGAYSLIKNSLNESTSPGVSDDSSGGYGVGSTWIDTTLDLSYVCLDASVGAAVWKTTTAATGTGDLIAANNLSDVSNAATSLANLGGLVSSNNLSDVANAATSLANLSGVSAGANSNITSLSGLTTPLTVAQGGTGAATFTDGGVLLGSAAGPLTALGVMADGDFLVGDGTTDPVLESGATVRTSLGLGTFATENTNAVPAQTLAGQITGADQTVSAINLKDAAYIHDALGDTSGADMVFNFNNGNVLSGTVSTDAVAISVSNMVASDEAQFGVLFLTNGGSQTVTFTGGDFVGGTAPALTTSGLDVLGVTSIDGGTTPLWFVLGLDVKSP